MWSHLTSGMQTLRPKDDLLSLPSLFLGRPCVVASRVLLRSYGLHGMREAPVNSPTDDITRHDRNRASRMHCAWLPKV